MEPGATHARGVAYAPHRRTQRSGRTTRLLVRLRERGAVAAYRATSGVAGAVPLRISLPVARALFVGAFHAWPPKQRAIVANAAHVLGRGRDDPEVRSLARRIYSTYARYVVELMRLPSLRPEAVAALLERERERERGGDSFDRLHRALAAQGRGMIAVAGHIGNIEVLAAAFAARGWPTYAVADDTAYPELYQLLAKQRRRWGIEVIAWRNLREIFRVLRRGAILGLLVDWGYRSDGIPVRFFDAWTTLPAGPAVLAARTGAPIVPVVIRRHADGRFRARHLDPIEVADDSPRALARATQAVASALEEMIEAAPDQWYTFKPIWPETKAEQDQLAARWRTMNGSSAEEQAAADAEVGGRA